MPIFKITTTINQKVPVPAISVRMVSAKSEMRAIRHVAEDTIKAEKLDGLAAVKLAGEGVALEEAAVGVED
jgi:hypothetical protein